MEIWLKQGKENYRFAVLPVSIEPALSMQNTAVNITNLGEINLIGKRGLKTLSLSSIFPKQEYSFVQYKGFPKPQKCVELIESWTDNPVRLIITGMNINMLVTIESFNHAVQDASGDIYFTLELKEYVIPKTTKKASKSIDKNTKQVVKPESKRDTKSVKSTVVTIKKGDTLASVAKKTTGSASNAKAIANQNNLSYPSRLNPGMKIKVMVS